MYIDVAIIAIHLLGVTCGFALLIRKLITEHHRVTRLERRIDMMIIEGYIRSIKGVHVDDERPHVVIDVPSPLPVARAMRRRVP